MIVEEAAASQGICKTIAANITERLFDCLQRPITCITGKDVNPVSRVLEIMTTVQDRDIVETVTLMMKKNLLTSGSELHKLSSSI